MKKLLVLSLATILFIACQEKPKQRYFEDSPEIEIAKSGIKAYETRDWIAWKANFADSAKVFHNSKKESSPDQIMEGMKRMLSNFSSYGFDKEENTYEMIIDEKGKTWVNFWGNWHGQANITDQKLVIPVHLTIEFVDGKITKEYGYYDTAGIGRTIAEIEEAMVAQAEANK